MTRRDVLIGATAVALMPRRAAAQAEAIPRVGVIASPARVETLRAALAAFGYRDGKNVVLDTPPFAFEHIPSSVRELLARNVRVIVVGGSENVKAVRAVSSTIPIVMALVGDPVGQGFIESFARPGGNVTGVSNAAVNLESKRLELLKEADPRVKRVAVLWNPGQPAHAEMLKAVDAAAQALGIVPVRVAVPSPADLEAAFATVRRERASGVTMLGSSIHFGALRTIAESARRAKLPSIGWTDEFTRAGGLLSYGASEDDQYRRAAGYVDRILKGARPAELPVEQPTAFQFAVNRATAAAIGLTLPPVVLARADVIIE